MPKSNQARSALSGLVDSDSEDHLVEVNAMPTPDSAEENVAPAKKGRARPKAAVAAKVTKAKAPASRASGRLEAKGATVPSNSKRKALADKTNQQEESDVEELDEFEKDEDVAMDDALDTPVVTIKDTKAKATKKKAPLGRGKAAKEVPTDPKNGTEEITFPSPEKPVLESQEPAMDIEGDEEVTQTLSRTAQSAQRSHSRPRQLPAQRRRGGSASDTERSDPALRRKLGEITKKYDNLNVKYQDLREIGLKEAERNFERLKKQSEEKTAASDKLIASLKADLASQSSLAKESRALKKKVESQVEEMATLKAQLAQTKSSLEETQAQNKMLATKLVANRSAAASVESVNTKGQGSTVTANGGIRIMGTAEAAQVAQAAQLKEDLYSDLTGLIIRGVKREADDDIFDCIQTGRNGTLHFKLAAANEKTTESYEEAQCQYVPQLDPGRDKDLMEILPDYLVDEISFPRPQAAKFYARVVKALTEKLE